jgi:hypothetical protein
MGGKAEGVWLREGLVAKKKDGCRVAKYMKWLLG